MNKFSFTALLLIGLSINTIAGNVAKAGKIIKELPTLECLGVRWLILGDDNANASVAVSYRVAGTKKWKKGMDLFRVQNNGLRKKNALPAGVTMHAGSIFYLKETTNYEVKLSLKDPDGGNTEKIISMKTWSTPQLPMNGPRITVKPGGLKAALKKARPGDTLVLSPGIYKGRFKLPSGKPGKPIAVVGAKKGTVILDGGGASNILVGTNAKHLYFKYLTMRNARWALAVNGGAYITVRYCLFTDVAYGFVGQQRANQQKRFYIADNTFIGKATWPRSKGIESKRAVQVAGTGHVICHNRVRNFGDAIDTFHAYPNAAIDIYRNEISECTDDGIELDYSQHNVRCYENRLTNVFQGITLQPIYGGPAYVFRNAIYNLGIETFKMHDNPSGILFFHNTSVKKGKPLILYGQGTVRNAISRNNIYIGTSGNYAYESTCKMIDCDFDYDGFGGKWKQFIKWNKKRYDTVADAKAAKVYPHVIRLKTKKLFASGMKAPLSVATLFPYKKNDLRLHRNSTALDKGVLLANINDGYTGKAPDLGAYELGSRLPHYGPRP